MIRKDLTQIPAVPMEKPGFLGMTARYALTREDGCPRYAMRLMEFEPGGCTSLHAHPEEHEFYFLDGEPVLVGAGGLETPVRPGEFVYVLPDEPHQIRNNGRTRMRVVCTIPILPGGDGKHTTGPAT